MNITNQRISDDSSCYERKYIFLIQIHYINMLANLIKERYIHTYTQLGVSLAAGGCSN